MSKNITFNFLKHYFNYFNISLYNTFLKSKILFYFITLLKYYIFIIYSSFLLFMRHLFLSLSVSLSSPSKNTQPTPLGHHQPPSTQCHHPQPITESINHGTPEKDFTPSNNTASTPSNPQQPSTKSINPHP